MLFFITDEEAVGKSFPVQNLCGERIHAIDIVLMSQTCYGQLLFLKYYILPAPSLLHHIQCSPELFTQCGVFFPNVLELDCDLFHL